MSDATCSIDDCGDPIGKHGARRMCGKHYKHWLAHDPSRPPGRQCELPGCGAKYFSRGWCQKHYGRWRVHGNPEWEPRPPRKGSICSAPDCEKEPQGRGLCSTHYSRWWKRGDIADPVVSTEEERFLAKVDRRGDDECWPFASVGPASRGGYGIFNSGGVNTGAHVWAYEHFVGPIPRGYHVDHVRANGCVRHDCVNWVRHLEAVTPRENSLRARTTKVPDDEAVDLYRRWRNGESQVSLGAEVGVYSSSLSRRFQRLRMEGLIPWEPPGEPSPSRRRGRGFAPASSSATTTPVSYVQTQLPM